jgi:hypothetical protein
MATNQDALLSELADSQAAFLKADLGYGFEFVKLASTNSPDAKLALQLAAKTRDSVQRFLTLAYLRDRDRKQILAQIKRLNAMIDRLTDQPISSTQL